ncbi:MAG: FtsW/RodA/SpoVE family cell cycle protein [Saccharofermentanales bacterium]
MKTNNEHANLKNGVISAASMDSSEVSAKYTRKKHIDLALFIVIFAMICFGFVMLFSASMTEGFASENDPMHFITKHFVFTAVGTVLALFIAVLVPVRWFDRLWLVVFLYAVTTALLILILLSDYIPANPIIDAISLNGASRWISILGMQFQPTEIAKFSMIFCFAGYISWAGRKRGSHGFSKKTAIGQAFFDGWIHIVIPALAIGFWFALIILEPHVSCIVILTILAIFLFLSAGLPAKSWLTGILILLVILLFLAAIFTVIQPLLPESVQNYVDFDYVKTRIAIYQDIDSVDADASFQTRQSINAIGSGGLFGVGFGDSVQKWGYLPMQYNDYVFSIIAEELGFVGAAAILLLFSVYLLLGIRIANMASNIHGTLIAFGFALLIPVQAFLNIGVATNVVPPTGITLPFFSYGGTSTMIFIVCTGFLLCVSKSGIKSKRRERG